jgi:hypothetical protein
VFVGTIEGNPNEDFVLVTSDGDSDNVAIIASAALLVPVAAGLDPLGIVMSAAGFFAPTAIHLF